MVKYTQGEWTAISNNVYANYSADIAQLICTTSGGNYKANARFIAATPQMYETLRELVVYLEQNEIYKGYYLQNAFKVLAAIDGGE